MERIKTDNRQIDKFGPGKDGFRTAVPGVSEPTYLSADFFNGLQESMMRVQEEAGMPPSADFGQFCLAIKTIADRISTQVQWAELPSIREKGAVDDPMLDQTARIDACENDASHDAFYKPPGTYNTTRPSLKKRYYGPGVVRTGWVSQNYATANPVVSESAWHPESTWVVDRPVMVFPPAMRESFNSGRLVGAFVGDSISEACDVSYGNSMAPMLRTMLAKQLPYCTVELANFSLLGRSMDNLASAAFVAGDPATTQANAPGTFWRDAWPHVGGGAGSNGTDSVLRTDVWPAGSVAGKSWMQHVKDTAPDFIVLALGTNNYGNEVSYVAALNAVWGDMCNWAKVPFLILVTPAEPSVTRQAEAVVPTQAIADAGRAMALQNGWGLIDANAVSRVVLDGVRTEYGQRLRERNFSGWGNSLLWAGASMTYSEVGAAPGYFGKVTANVTPSLHIRKIRARDVDISAKITYESANAMPFMTLRSSSDANGHAGILVRLESGGSLLRVYDKESQMASIGTGLALGAGDIVRLRVLAIGGMLAVWVNSVLLVNGYGYIRTHWSGSLGFGFDLGTGSMSEFEFEYAPDIRHSTSICGEYQVFGPPPGLGGSTIGYRDDANFYGGDGIHHPSSEGHQRIYVPAVARCVYEVIQELKKPFPLVRRLSAQQTNTTGADKKIAGTTVTVLSASPRNEIPATMRVNISLPYSNSGAAGTLSLYSGKEDAPIAVMRSWYLDVGAGNKQFSVEANIPVGHGPQSFHLRWTGTGLSAGAVFFPIEISATVFN